MMRWLLVGAMLLASSGHALAAPSATYGKKAGADWQWVDPAQGSPGGYSMDFEATINVDGTYVGKSAYRRQRALNAAKLAGGIVASAATSPIGGIAAAVLLEAGFQYLNGGFQKKDTGQDTGYPKPGFNWYVQSSARGGPDPQTACYNFFVDIGGPTVPGYTYAVVADSGMSSSGYMCQTKVPSGGVSNYRPINTGGGCATGYTLQGSLCVKQSDSWVSATPAEVQTALESKITGMTPTAAHLLADWAWKTQGIELGTFTDYNGNVIAGPFSFQLPTKTSTSIDPVTGIRYDTNVVQAVEVSANTDIATSEADPLVLTQNETKTETATKPDGSKETKTTTTTTTGGKNRDEAEAAGAFQAPSAELYTKKDKTMSSVLNSFTSTVQQAPWYTATTGWFNVTVSSAACPVWVVPKTDFTPAVDMSGVFCSQQALTIYGIAGMAVIVVAAWAAFRIAFL